MLDVDQKNLFQQMMDNFDDITEDEMNSGLSIIFMNYPSAGNYDGTYNYIIKEHSKLFEDWTPNRVEELATHSRDFSHELVATYVNTKT